MMERKYQVLFLCTGNSARSILAEAGMNHLAASRDKFTAYSAGSHPKAAPHPLALELLRQNGFPIEGLRSKSWGEFSRPESPKMDFIFTVCDNAAGEQCPLWLGQPVTAHWGVPDPAAVEGTDAQKRLAFVQAYQVLRRRIELLASLPLDKLDRAAMQARLAGIGRQ